MSRAIKKEHTDAEANTRGNYTSASEEIKSLQFQLERAHGTIQVQKDELLELYRHIAVRGLA